MKIVIVLLLFLVSNSNCNFLHSKNWAITKREIPQSQPVLIKAGKALQIAYQIEALFKQLDEENLEDLSFDQKVPMAFKLVELHNWVDKTMSKVLAKRLNSPFSYPRAVYQ